MTVLPGLLTARPSRHPDVAWRSWGGEVVILTPAGHDARAAAALADGAEHDLNEVGSRIWELCDGARTVADIARALAEEFEVEDADAQEDAAAFVAQLAEMKLLVLGAEAHAP